MVAAGIETDRILQVRKPILLFKGERENAPSGHCHYDSSLDGQQFLMVKHGRRSRLRSVHVIEEWAIHLDQDSAP